MNRRQPTGVVQAAPATAGPAARPLTRNVVFICAGAALALVIWATVCATASVGGATAAAGATVLAVALVAVVGIVARDAEAALRQGPVSLLAAQMVANERLEQRLHQSHKMEALGRLAGGVAHDFNNLLTVISANVAFVEDELPGGSDAREAATDAARAADRAADLTRQLLASSRRETARYERVNVDEVLDAVEPLLLRLLGEDIDLRVDRGAPRAVLADAGQLQQVLLNLAINSRDAMPEGGPLRIASKPVTLADDVSVSTGPLTAGAYARITIADAGVGIEGAALEKIFEPFFTTKPVGQGTGLGLAMVHGIVGRLGGGIDIDTHVGFGTTLSLFLPAAELAGRPIAPLAIPDAAGDANGQIVLLVEDDDAVRAAVRGMLRRRGYGVEGHGTGLAAVEWTRDNPGARVDLLLTDAIMPGLDGLDVIERVQRLRPEIPALMMSGYTGNVLKRRGPDTPVFPIISKPVQQDQLHARIQHLLAEHPSVSRPSAG